MLCNKCKKEIADESTFCSFCGNKVEPTEDNASMDKEAIIKDAEIITEEVIKEEILEEVIENDIIEEEIIEKEVITIEINDATKDTEEENKETTCYKCGEVIKEDEIFCTNCGAATSKKAPEVTTTELIVTETKKCPSCGQPHDDELDYCSFCGAPLDADSSPKSNIDIGKYINKDKFNKFTKEHSINKEFFISSTKHSAITFLTFGLISFLLALTINIVLNKNLGINGMESKLTLFDIMQISLLNKVHIMSTDLRINFDLTAKFGIWPLLFIPVISIIIARFFKKPYKKFEVRNVLSLLTSAFIFAVVLNILSLLFHAYIFNIKFSYNFFISIINTTVVLFIIQCFIELFAHKSKLLYIVPKNWIQGTRALYKGISAFLGIALIFTCIAVFALFFTYTNSYVSVLHILSMIFVYPSVLMSEFLLDMQTNLPELSLGSLLLSSNIITVLKIFFIIIMVYISSNILKGIDTKNEKHYWLQTSIFAICTGIFIGFIGYAVSSFVKTSMIDYGYLFLGYKFITTFIHVAIIIYLGGVLRYFCNKQTWFITLNSFKAKYNKIFYLIIFVIFAFLFLIILKDINNFFEEIINAMDNLVYTLIFSLFR